jgi:hypothetical protein
MKKRDYIIFLIFFIITTSLVFVLNIYGFGHSTSESLIHSLAFFVGEIIGCTVVSVIHTLWIKFGFANKKLSKNKIN